MTMDAEVGVTGPQVKRHPEPPEAQFSSVSWSCLTLCDPLDCSTPSFPVHHQLPELAHTHAH